MSYTIYAQIRHVLGTSLLSKTRTSRDSKTTGPSNSSGTFSGFEATACTRGKIHGVSCGKLVLAPNRSFHKEYP